MLAAVASFVPEEMITLYTTASHQRLELDSHFAKVSARLSALDT